MSIRPVNPSHQGSSIQLQKWNWLSEASVTAAKTPLTEEADVALTKLPATTPVTLTPAEYGFAVSTTRYFENRTMAPFDEHKARAIADHCGKVIDELLQDKIKAGVVETYKTGANDTAQVNTEAGGLQASDVRKIVTQFRADNVPTYDSEFYVAVVHPNVVHDLRAASGPGSWRVAKEYINDSLIRRGEVGEFEGVRFVQNNRVRLGTGTGTRSFNNYFLGAGALAEFVKVEPTIKVGPVVDNLGRFRTLGWYADLDFGVYEDKAIKDLVTGSTLG